MKKIEAGVFLKELHSKLDLALKYHHDLIIGVDSLSKQFKTSRDELGLLQKISEKEWPTLEMFGPTFSEPFLKQQLDLAELFEKRIEDFSEGVHPGDALFQRLLKDALIDLREALPKLVWLEAGRSLSIRVSDAQRDLQQALVSVKPLAAKLRRSKAVASAVRQLVVAERMGPAGWPMVQQSLETIESSIKAV